MAVQLCASTDVAQRLRRALTNDEDTYVDGLIEEASALVIAYCGGDPSLLDDEDPDTIPDGVVLTVSRMVARVFSTDNDTNVDQAAAGPFSGRFVPGATSGGPWLTQVDKVALRAFRVNGGLVSAQLVSEQYDPNADEDA